MTKNDPRKALGKGLHSLLPKRNTVATAPPASETPKTEEFNAPAPAERPDDLSVQTLPIEHVRPNPNQPRREFDPVALAELTLSITRDGIIQPIIVRKQAPNDYQIIAGERRWRAATAARLKEVPVIVRIADDEQVLELAIIENIQREDLNPIELALAFQRMAAELGLSHDQIGQKTGKERTTVTNSVRLLQLPHDVQQMIAAKRLSSGHARALLKFEDDQTRRDIAQRCIAEGWSVRQIEDFTRSGPAADRKGKKKEPLAESLDPNVKAAIDELERTLGTKVHIVEKGGGRGRIEVEYYSPDDLNRIYEMIVGETT